MGKGSSFVIGFSVVLIILFIIFSFLMATVNPPMKVSPDGALVGRNRSNARLWNAIRKSGLEDIYYDDNVLLPVDNIEYGLDKTAKRNNAAEIQTLNFNNAKCTAADVYLSNINVPTTFYNRNIASTQNLVKNSTEKSAKGWRRSIKEEKAKKRYLYLKIFNDDDPRLEIKLYSDKHLEIKSREHANSSTKLKTLTTGNNFSNVFGTKQHYKQPMIKIEEDKTLLFNIERNSIKLLNKSGISFIKLNDQQDYFNEHLEAVNETTPVNIFQGKDQEIPLHESEKLSLYGTVGTLNNLTDINTFHKEDNSNAFSKDRINMSETKKFHQDLKLNKDDKINTVSISNTKDIYERHVLNGEDTPNLFSNNVNVSESSVNHQEFILNREDLPNSFNINANQSTTEAKDIKWNGDNITNLIYSLISPNVPESGDFHQLSKSYDREPVVNEDSQPNLYSEDIIQTTEAVIEVFTLNSIHHKDVWDGDNVTNLFDSEVNLNVSESEDIHQTSEPKDHQELIINEDKKPDYLGKTLSPNISEINITYEGLALNQNNQSNSYSENMQSTEAYNNKVLIVSSDEISETSIT